jgi:hypothetical protein
MRSSWAANVLLPAAQVIAEGAWIAVCYAALQALTGAPPWMGPLELGVAAWAGMAWGRRRRWTGTAAEAFGLPVLALVAGACGWLLDPGVRLALVQGEPMTALGLHGPGWLAAIAFWRGEAHRTREDDDAIQHQLLRWAIPGLAIPWAIGHLVASGPAESEFRAAAFVGTVFFIGAAFTAMGLARLEAVRATTGSDWRANRSWVVLVLGMAIGLTVLAVPTAAFLGVPARSLLVAVLGPLQTLIFVLVLLATPIILLAAAAAELIQPLLPEGFGLGQFRIPGLNVDQREVTSGAPTLLFYIIVAVLLAIELAVLALIIYFRWQERRRMRVAMSDPFEERAIVIPERDEPPPPRPGSGLVPRRRFPEADPVGAYLAALRLLERDGRWPRRADETPAAHAGRLRREGAALPGMGRLAGAYQLIRYGGRALPERERNRAPGRLHRLRAYLRRGA